MQQGLFRESKTNDSLKDFFHFFFKLIQNKNVGKESFQGRSTSVGLPENNL